MRSGADQMSKTMAVSSHPRKHFCRCIAWVGQDGDEAECLDTLRRLCLGGAGTVFVPDIRESEVPTLVEVRSD